MSTGSPLADMAALMSKGCRGAKRVSHRCRLGCPSGDESVFPARAGLAAMWLYWLHSCCCQTGLRQCFNHLLVPSVCPPGCSVMGAPLRRSVVPGSTGQGCGQVVRPAHGHGHPPPPPSCSANRCATSISGSGLPVNVSGLPSQRRDRCTPREGRRGALAQQGPGAVSGVTARRSARARSRQGSSRSCCCRCA